MGSGIFRLHRQRRHVGGDVGRPGSAGQVRPLWGALDMGEGKIMGKPTEANTGKCRAIVTHNSAKGNR